MRNVLRRYKWKLLLVLMFILIPFIVSYETSYPIYILNLIGIWAIVALALNLLVGFGGQISIGQVGFFAIGAYASAIFTGKLDLSFWLALPLAGIFTALVGFVIGLPAVRLSGHFLAVATLGFGVAVPQIALKWEGLTGGASGMVTAAPKLGSLSFGTDNQYYFIILIVLILVVWGISNLLKTGPGRAFMAIRDSEIAAQAMGINVPLYKALLFSVSAFFTGIAGSLYAHLVNYIGPDDFHLVGSFLALAMVVVGGLASIPGSILGAAFLTFVPELTADVKGLSFTLTGFVLILVVLFLPKGLIGLKDRFTRKNDLAKNEPTHPRSTEIINSRLSKSAGGRS